MGKAKVRLCLCPLPEQSTHLVLQALTFIIFICFTASISAYMAAALLEFFITLAFLFLYATQYYQRFDRLNWPCLVRDPASSTPFFLIQSFPRVLLASLLFLSQYGGWSSTSTGLCPKPVPCIQNCFDPH